MRIEITSAAQFLVDLVRLNTQAGSLSNEQLERFKANVSNLLQRHYTNHWFPDQPFKGSGYRCIRINGKMDPLIAQAGFMMGLAVSFLRSLFPTELTMWIDPREVSYRIGENGSICILYEGEKKATIITTKKGEKASPAANSATAAPTEGPLAKTPEKCIGNRQQQVPSTPSTPPSSQQQAPSPPPGALPNHHHLSSPPPPQQQQVHHHHPHHFQHHFSPSKSAVVVSSPLQLSRPMSPAVTTQQNHHQQQQHVASVQQPFSLLFMNKENGLNGLTASIKCKESLPRGLDMGRPLQMDQRLFVSS